MFLDVVEHKNPLLHLRLSPTCAIHLNLLVRCFEYNIPVDANFELVPRRHLDRRLDVQVPTGDLSSSLAEFLAYRASCCLCGRWVCQSTLAGSLRYVERGSKHAS